MIIIPYMCIVYFEQVHLFHYVLFPLLVPFFLIEEYIPSKYVALDIASYLLNVVGIYR
jgi:hypothetical protein